MKDDLRQIWDGCIALVTALSLRVRAGASQARARAACALAYAGKAVERARQSRETLSLWQELSRVRLLTWHTVLLALILALPFTVRILAVSGGSMEPTFQAGDRLVVENVTKHLHIWRGEVLVIRNPHERVTVEVKRVVGLPGEVVELSAEGITINPDCEQKPGAPLLYHVNSAPCSAHFPAGTVLGGTGNDDFQILLGPEDYFVLGDNRSRSTDSRDFGAVQKGDVIGRVILAI